MIKHHFKYFILLLIALTLAMMCFYHPLYGGHDMFFHLNRIITLMNALKNGEFPVYMDYLMINGYGYISKIFYSDLLLVPIAVIGNIFNLETAYQSLIFINTIACGIIAFYSFHGITKDKYAAILGSIFYTFSAYRILDIYIRSAVGEIFAFTFLPLILYAAYEIVYGNYKKWYILTIAFTLLIYSHLISSILSFILIIILLLVNYKRLYNNKKRIYYLILSAIVCCVLLAYYIFPMFEQMLSNTFLYQIKEGEIEITTYNFRSFVYSFFSTYIKEYKGFYTTVGILLLLPLSILFFIKKEKKTPLLKFINILVIVGIVCIVASLSIFPWNIYPFKIFQFMQFSWRLILFSTLFFSLAAGYYISLWIEHRNKRIVALGIIIIAHLITLNINSKYYDYFGQIAENTITGNIFNIDQNIPKNRKIVISGAQYIPLLMLSPYDSSLDDRGIVVIHKNESTSISNFSKNKGHITFDVEVTADDNLELPLTYYIGYKVTLDNNPINYQQSPNGLIEISVNKSGKVEMQYEGTILQKICWYITILSSIIFVLYIIITSKQKKI